MYVLKELWWGNISPTDRRVRQGSEYQQTAKEVREKMGEFLETLSPEAREQLETINDLKSDLSVMANEDYFLYGNTAQWELRASADLLPQSKG